MWEPHTSTFGLRWGGTLYRARKNVVIKEALAFEIACFFLSFNKNWLPFDFLTGFHCFSSCFLSLKHRLHFDPNGLSKWNSFVEAMGCKQAVEPAESMLCCEYCCVCLPVCLCYCLLFACVWLAGWLLRWLAGWWPGCLAGMLAASLACCIACSLLASLLPCWPGCLLVPICLVAWLLGCLPGKLAGSSAAWL